MYSQTKKKLWKKNFSKIFSGNIFFFDLDFFFEISPFFFFWGGGETYESPFRGLIGLRIVSDTQKNV